MSNIQYCTSKTDVFMLVYLCIWDAWGWCLGI